MDLQTWLPSITLPALFILAISVCVVWMTTARCRNKLPYPPGPAGLPVIGNMLMMDQLTHQGLAQLSKRYGEIVHLRLGLLHMVSVSSPRLAREILQTQDSIFSNKPTKVAITYLTYNRSDMVFANNGPFWRQMRKLCVVKLFSRKRAQYSWAAVQNEIKSTIAIISSKCGSSSPVEIGELVFQLTSNITYRAAFASSLIEGQGEFVSIMQEFSLLFSAFNIADFFPGLSWVDPQGLNKRLYKARQSLDRFIDKIIDDHLAKSSAQEETDMLDDLLDFYNQEANQIKSDGLELCLTKENIKAMIMDIMFGGTETVGAGIEWAMAELLRSPEDLKRVQQELEEVVGVERRVNESDLDKLTYFKCVIKEVLRLHPPIPLLLHETSADAELDGYHIPARSHVIINVWAIGRDDSVWEEVNVFKPARFLEKDAPDFKGSSFEFLPFGSGRRFCPGMQLGLYAMELAVANLVHCFSWELPKGVNSKELNMDEVCGITAPRATRLFAVPSYRLKCALP